MSNTQPCTVLDVDVSKNVDVVYAVYGSRTQVHDTRAHSRHTVDDFRQ